jgi:lipopolysaccharide/colanic/teichoic acid biosynthesis glycosyltransferase
VSSELITTDISDGNPARVRLFAAPEILPEFAGWQLILKRVIDVLGALVLLAMFLPFGLVIGSVVKLSSPGPVFFRQDRVGMGGRPFRMIKFRSMRDGTHSAIYKDPEAQAAYEANGFKLGPSDPRVTKIGRLLRASSVDEVPQLLNVLMGHMSLVGIRPIEPRQLAQRSEFERRCYASLRPGMTGLWQVSGRSTSTDEERRRLDCRYVQSWSPWLDLKVMLRTPFAVFAGSH